LCVTYVNELIYLIISEKYVILLLYLMYFIGSQIISTTKEMNIYKRIDKLK